MNPEENNPLQPAQNPQQPVMDIARPGPTQMVSPQTVAPSVPETPTPQQFASVSPESQPAVPQPDPGAQEVGVPNYEEQHLALNKQVKKKRRGLIIVIILAVIITLGLIGAAGYVYLDSQKEEPAATETTQTTETADDGVVDETDIDETTAEIDDALNSVNDSEDFSTSDLSDDGIGL